MMFEHAEFEREVRELQDAITGQHGFGERPSNKWNARSRPQRMVKLLKQYRGSLSTRADQKASYRSHRADRSTQLARARNMVVF